MVARLFAVILFSACALRAGSVVVMPFFNESNAPNLDWIGESIAEYVREALASEGLLVLDREDRLEACRRLSVKPNAMLTHATVFQIGESLDASTIIYGYFDVKPPAVSPQQAAGTTRGALRITARILDLDRLRQGPEYAESGPLEDLSLLETRLGWQSLQFLSPATAPAEQEFLKLRPPVRVDAVESYVRGLLAPVAEQKHRFFTQAARLDEQFSQPCFQLGKGYWEKKEYRVAAGWLERVRRSDSRYLEAQFFLGLCRYHNGDFAGAAQCFERVASSVPLNEVFNNLGAAQDRQDLAAATENFRKALEGDSADPDYHFNLGYALWRKGQFDQAAESFRAALERRPDDAEAMTFLGRSLQKSGPRPAEIKGEGRERVKNEYEENAYRQLKAELERKK